MAKVEGFVQEGVLSASLSSSPTKHQLTPENLLRASLELFSLLPDDLDERYPSAIIEAGARHLMLCLRDRPKLSKMAYNMTFGAALMRKWGLATICLLQSESPTRFHARNAFAAGGVYEDPATGAAAAAFVAYLYETGHKVDEIEIAQGYDMGSPCLIHAKAPTIVGGASQVLGTVRVISDDH